MSNRAARRRATKVSCDQRRSTFASDSPTSSVDREFEGAEAEALVVTHLVDLSADDWPGSSATIRLTGRRVGAHGHRDLRDTFTQDDQVDGIVPGSGQASITSTVYGLAPGEWEVTAAMLPVRDGWRDRLTSGATVQPARWSWRGWALSADAPRSVKTRWAPLVPLAPTPGVVPGAWPVLGGIGVLVALAAQQVMLPHEKVAVEVPLWVSLIALVSGLLGAKIWYALLHPGPWPQAILGGWAVDGFLVTAPAVAVGLLAVFGLPVAAFLDAVTPGLFLAVAIGRIGCFLAGCCAGRVTDSRWGIPSSDRKVLARRIPTQLLEAAAGLILAAVATLVILGHAPRIDGSIFIVALVTYFLVRQSLLRVRAEPRAFLWRRTPSAGLTA